MLCKIIAMLIVPEVIELIELLKSKDKVVGSKQTKKALEQSRTTAVFMASDADQKIIYPIKQLCDENGIPVYNVETMKQLGKLAGIDVGASIVGILK